MDPQEIYTAVQSRYGSAALEPSTSNNTSIAKAFGYTSTELSSIPSDANLGLSCGNPIALAALQPGETVIDLGSGAGFDVFLAAKRVGPNGRAIGVDMNEAMLARANLNVSKLGPAGSNISFIHSPITSISLPPDIADCIISNCVINLVPEAEKPLAFAEMYRLLKHGGRVAISDILAKKPLPEELKQSMALYVGCIAGAGQVREYERYLREVGFENILIVDAHNDLNVYKESSEDGSKVVCCGKEEKTETKAKGCCGNGSKKDCCDMACCEGGEKKYSCCSGEDVGILKEMTRKYKDLDFNEWAGSFKIYAVKP